MKVDTNVRAKSTEQMFENILNYDINLRDVILIVVCAM